MARYWESTRVAWFVAFLARFPTPEACVLSREAFVHAAWALVGRKVHKRAKLDELYELAHRSIALPVLLDAPAIETFRLQLEQLRRLATLRDELEARAHALLQGRADFQHLCSLPGVASILALVILAEGGDLRASGIIVIPEVLRLGPREVPSGQSRGRETLSKRGNARPAWPFGWRPSELCG